MTNIAIVASADDIHAKAVQLALRRRHNLRARIIAAHQIAASGQLSWSPAGMRSLALPGADGAPVEVGMLDTIWYRRPATRQALAPEVDEDYRAMIESDCSSALIGALLTGFRGTWASHPIATMVAGNKLVQMSAAVDVGLAIPDTLVSQAPTRIREFCRHHRDDVVVKVVRGTMSATAATTIRRDVLNCDATLGLAPTIYQQKVSGTRHLRVHCFGDECVTALIASDDLDWRFDLNRPIQPYELDAETRQKARALLDRLNLAMGVFDFKLDEDGKPVFLEVNPQGQFLFIEGLCGIPLTNRFADYLALSGADRREPERALQ